MIKLWRLFLFCGFLLWTTGSYAQESSNSDFYVVLAQAALERTQAQVSYNGAYYSLNYPNGDVPAEVGVCTDVVVRSYRKLNIDLQSLVHQDMSENFSVYPRLWGLSKPDPNIDHRRVPNLMRFFERQGATMSISPDPGDYRAGDIVAWDLGHGIKHIGVVSNKEGGGGRPLIVHNIGQGPQLEDMLFNYVIIGHYRYGG